jgi:inorganic pyrophosphatase
MAMVRRFFQDYKQLEGKEVDVDEILPAKKAYTIIESSLAAYRTKYSPSRRKKSKS